ncbi:DUF4244 domain-containing protein [Quadrisphaera sp. DSM 44207]|uniref:DUF4244 domain-containing protein n=1 Tax=Quadrisphaera sp. DSM 44207 TaxID=1881057 RepID=UPI000880EC77|nr:DUF4244 domain-containing protein [Quadrisphaera sp. DSM 44207]SDQ17724.1 Protein of unknown function [Quadrisphaera sp. DSM 44207]
MAGRAAQDAEQVEERVEERGRGAVQPPEAAVARRSGRTALGDAGMATAEYAVATLAACGFAGLLVAVLGSGEVRGMLLSIVRRALTLG